MPKSENFHNLLLFLKNDIKFFIKAVYDNTNYYNTTFNNKFFK